ncbi:hypothetical protein Runsl_0358 [Runella slithyformis DSM 19594]|uniref:Uncharacterized protein n=1 Tax=Runella slithyformis (strain ATCC 29530 / DSM 19594 / LMG 11500 / NCIMB 11436 / LSU 4) TaxID=761193 RepID=A0A7U3ZGN6_RUNSL|nr:hypothetical protein Runsl_0358 [Runella slithyformis DSM 19594]
MESVLNTFLVLPSSEEGHHLLGILAYCLIIFEHLRPKRRKDDD